MAIPVNPDKTLSHRTDKPLQSNTSLPSGQEQQAKGSVQARPGNPLDSRVDVDTARQLYQMENQRTEAPGTGIGTPQQARTLLDSILQQFIAAPETALRAQSPTGPAALANLLERAPA